MKRKSRLFTILSVLSLSFGSIALLNKRDLSKVSAAPVKTEVSAIKLKLDGNTIWGWTNYDIWYFDAVVREGTPEYGNKDEYGIAANNTELSNYSKVFPENVESISFLLKGTNGDDNREEYMGFKVYKGESLVGDPEWNAGEGQGQLKLISRADYFTQYKLHDGLEGGINNDKVRLWLYRGHYGTNDATVVLNIDDNLIVASGHSKSRPGDENDHHKYFAYFDVLKTDVVGKEIKFHKVKGDNTTIWNTSTSHTYVEGDNNKLFKLPINDDGTNLLSHGPIEGQITNHFFAKVLEGYLTCSPSIENGYGAFAAMDENFLPRVDGDKDNWDIDDNLGGIEIQDYSGVGVGKYGNDRDWEDAEGKVDAYVKYSWLKARYELHVLGGSGVAQPINTPATTGAVLIIGLLSVTTLAGFYFLQKKKYS